MKMQASASGSGKITAGEVIAQLTTVPQDAVVNIRTQSSQMDGPSWSISAEWEPGPGQTARTSLYDRVSQGTTRSSRIQEEKDYS